MIQSYYVNPDIAIIKGYTKKIDNESINGLSGVPGSLSYDVNEIDNHIHSNEKWFGLASTPNGEIHRADRAGASVLPFTLIAGVNNYGSWVQILGSNDTPVKSGMIYFDLHRVLITTTNSTNNFIIQIVSGESTEISNKLSNELYTEFMFTAATNSNDSGITVIQHTRILKQQKVWARTCCINDNGSEINFYIGLHEYEG